MGWLLYADSFLLYTQRKLSLEKGDFLVFIQYCLICCSSDSTVSEDAGIKARTVETLVGQSDALTNQLDLFHNSTRSHLIHTLHGRYHS
jgi:hypothetical protein